MELPERVEIRPDVMFGKPCIRGTRILVYLILEKLAADETMEELLEAYPQLERKDLAAALAYAAAIARDEVVLAEG